MSQIEGAGENLLLLVTVALATETFPVVALSVLAADSAQIPTHPLSNAFAVFDTHHLGWVLVEFLFLAIHAAAGFSFCLVLFL